MNQFQFCCGESAAVEGEPFRNLNLAVVSCTAHEPNVDKLGAFVQQNLHTHPATDYTGGQFMPYFCTIGHFMPYLRAPSESGPIENKRLRHRLWPFYGCNGGQKIV